MPLSHPSFRVSLQRRTRLLFLPVLCAPALLASGCGVGAGDAASTPAGVPASPDTARLEAVWSLQVGQEPIVALAVDPSGGVAVALGRQIVTVGADGTSADTLQAGVPEAARITGLAFGAVDEGGVPPLHARTEEPSGLHRVGASAASLLSDLPSSPVLRGRDALFADRDGVLYVGLPPAYGPDMPEATFPRPAYLRLSAEGGTPDTLVVPAEVAATCPLLESWRFSSGWFRDFRQRYLPMATWGLTRDGGLLVGCPDEYRFEIHGPTGSVAEARGPFRPVAVPDVERTDVSKAWILQMNNSGRFEEEWKWSGPGIPPEKPAYLRLLGGDDGRIWVWPAHPSDPNPAPEGWAMVGGLPTTLWSEAQTGTFDVFDSTGAFQGHLRLPPEVRYTPFPDTPDPVIRGDTVWTVTNVPGVVARYRVVRGETVQTGG